MEKLGQAAVFTVTGWDPVPVHRGIKPLPPNSSRDGTFSGGDTEVFKPLIGNLTDHDYFLVLADYADYIRSQDEVSRTWRDIPLWTRMSILNTARSGKFSSDRAIAEYCDDIWNVGPVTIAD